MPSKFPKLWIVATPIGNPGDLSPRARDILGQADLVLAEDTRRTGRLLRECGIEARRMTSFFEHNEAEKQAGILNLLKTGANIALVSDAGTPLLSDPGYRLVRACRQDGIPVSPVPGPSAPLAALCACGIAPLPFSFLGFPHKSPSARKALFQAFARVPGSLVFFERKDRLADTLAEAHEILGSRELAICRELTKTHEEFIIGELGDHASIADNLLGELTIVIGPPRQKDRATEDEALNLLRLQLARGAHGRKAVAAVRALCPGWSADELYALLQDLKNRDEPAD